MIQTGRQLNISVPLHFSAQNYAPLCII